MSHRRHYHGSHGRVHKTNLAITRKRELEEHELRDELEYLQMVERPEPFLRRPQKQAEAAA